MEIQQTIKSEHGSTLLTENDGVIVQGRIFSSAVDEEGKPQGGLIGGSDLNACYAYSWEELINALNIPENELRVALERKEREWRSTSHDIFR